MNITNNRCYRDTLFKIIFGAKHKDNALALYNAINKSNYSNVDDLEIYTIEDALYMNVKNDVAFLFDESLNMYEQQSTYNPNMPLRGLAYFDGLYTNYINRQYHGHDVVFRSWQIKIPTPHYYVFYNGAKDMPEVQDMHLSDAYKGEGDLEITAHVLNINCGKNKELFDACTPLAGYSELIKRIKDNLAKGCSREEAVQKAIDSCVKDGILVEILTREVSEVTNSLLEALTDEEIERLHQSEIEHGREEGREEGAGLKDALYKCMRKDGRLDDYDRSVEDQEYYIQLLKEYGLTEKK